MVCYALEPALDLSTITWTQIKMRIRNHLQYLERVIGYYSIDLENL